jgi:hypothetical protein
MLCHVAPLGWIEIINADPPLKKIRFIPYSMLLQVIRASKAYRRYKFHKIYATHNEGMLGRQSPIGFQGFVQIILNTHDQRYAFELFDPS